MISLSDLAYYFDGWKQQLNSGPLRPKTSPRWGLLLGMIGVAILFCWGPPQPSFSEGAYLQLEDSTPLPGMGGMTAAEYSEQVHAERETYRKMSGLGLALVFVGFLIQLSTTIYSQDTLTVRVPFATDREG